MAEYNPSKIIKDGNTYNFRDTTKIPLAGTNALSGSIVPSTDNSVDLGASSKNIKMLYTKGITINGTQFLPSDYIPRAGGAVLTGWLFARNVNDSLATYCGGNNFDNGASVRVHGKDYVDSTYAGTVLIRTKNDSNYSDLFLQPDGTALWGNKNLAMQEDVIPRSGGAVLNGAVYARTVDNSNLRLCGGTHEGNGAYIQLTGNNADYSAGLARILVKHGTATTIYYFEGSNFAPNNHPSLGAPNYEWGQIYSTNSTISTSDARVKNSIKNIDDKLLDAWGNIEPKQYKFNDATEKKGEKARYHTGYLAQDIQAECEKQGTNASDYGLFCYDEWEEQEEEIEEIETEKDGKTIKEKHIIQPKREKGNLYALRYEEALVVECAYLRKKLKELTARIEELESSK